MPFKLAIYAAHFRTVKSCKSRNFCEYHLWTFSTSLTEYKPDSFNAMTVLTLSNQESAITNLPVPLMSLGRLKVVAHVPQYMATCSFSCMTSLPLHISSLIAIFDHASAISFILLLIGHGFFYLDFIFQRLPLLKSLFFHKVTLDL